MLKKCVMRGNSKHLLESFEKYLKNNYNRKMNDQLASTFLKGIKAECILNREGDILPYGYFNPETEGKLWWMCGEDEEKRITSVFCFDNAGQREKACKYLNNLEEAKYMRDELIKNGWKKLVPPKLEFTMPGADSKQKPLNRKQKRHLANNLEKLGKYINPAETTNPSTTSSSSSDTVTSSSSSTL